MSVFTASIGSVSVTTIRTPDRRPISLTHLLNDTMGKSDHSMLMPQYENQSTMNALLLNIALTLVCLCNNTNIPRIVSTDKIFLSIGLPSIYASAVVEVVPLSQKETGLAAE